MALPTFPSWDSRGLITTAVVTIVYQLTFFAIAAVFKFDKVTDFAGGTNFVVLAVLTLVLGGNASLPSSIAGSAMVVLWGLRLSIFLLLRILAWGEDRRFDDRREQLCEVFKFWVYQMFWVWTVSLPVTLANTAPDQSDGPLSPTTIIGWALFALGWLVETVADQQKLHFKNDSANAGKWCDAGLWAWSRHPNYVGEITLWIGVWLACTQPNWPVLWAWLLSMLGPLFTFSGLMFLSGLPLLEKSADKRYGSQPAYVEYKKRTSPLFLVPPPVYGALPSFLKALIFFEWPLYDSGVLKGTDDLEEGLAADAQ